MIGYLYRAVMVSEKAILASFLFSLNVGVSMLFSTEKGSLRSFICFGLSSGLNLLASASCQRSSKIAYLSTSLFSRSATSPAKLLASANFFTAPGSTTMKIST